MGASEGNKSQIKCFRYLSCIDGSVYFRYHASLSLCCEVDCTNVHVATTHRKGTEITDFLLMHGSFQLLQ